MIFLTQLSQDTCPSVAFKFNEMEEFGLAQSMPMAAKPGTLQTPHDFVRMNRRDTINPVAFDLLVIASIRQATDRAYAEARLRRHYAVKQTPSVSR
ncbi:hypothetical protein [Novosphingobium sp.]|uniref:hypothetical protein n=1 Tax=Novosphingobium sp. TaxID=1874826 RepID=UPI00260C689B|nr:hypothetical protein [Novosphingobium sp.]